MRLISYQIHSGPRLAARRGDEYIDLHAVDSSIPTSMTDFLAGGRAMLATRDCRAQEWLAAFSRHTEVVGAGSRRRKK